MSGHFRVTSSPDGLHVFTLVGDGQRQLVQSVLHRSREQLIEAMELVRRAARNADACRCARSLDGQLYFQLRDDTGQLLASSNLYGDLAALRADLDELMRLAGQAAVVDAALERPPRARTRRTEVARTAGPRR